MDIAIYLQPVNIPDFKTPFGVHQRQMGDIMLIYEDEGPFPDLDGIEIAILGVMEDRACVGNEGCAEGPDKIREKLYRLYQGHHNAKIADIGNIRMGHSVEDTYYALQYVVAELLRNNIIPVIIGGSQELTYAHYLAYESVGRIINIVGIDSSFNLGNEDSGLDSASFLSKIILHQPNFLFNFANLGYQTYYVDQEALKLMKSLLFDTYRLGMLRADITEAEPVIRNADMLSFDISAIRKSDAPGNANAGPNGFTGEEACQLIRYAGLSDKLTSLGFYEYNPRFDLAGATAELVAQMIWYFIDGYYQRRHDFPFKNPDHYLKYTVHIDEGDHEIEFYKSKNTGKWWMKVPLGVGASSKYERHYLVPCAYSDYERAMRNDIPDRWWQVYQKLM
jgi:formiminoglutamase